MAVGRNSRPNKAKQECTITDLDEIAVGRACDVSTRYILLARATILSG